MNTKFEVALRIRAARKAKGYSQEKLGELIGTSRIQVNRWENGVHVPGQLYRRGLATVLDIDFTDLDEDETEAELLALMARIDDLRAFRALRDTA